MRGNHLLKFIVLLRCKNCPDFCLGLLYDCFRLWTNPTTGRFYFLLGIVNYCPDLFLLPVIQGQLPVETSDNAFFPGKGTIA